MAKVKVRLLKPLNGSPIGTMDEYSERDAARLEKLNAVERVNALAAKASRPPSNKMQPPPANKSDSSMAVPPAAAGEAKG